jgi:hypothetical protein
VRRECASLLRSIRYDPSMPPIADLAHLLRTLSPVLHPDACAFVSLSSNVPLDAEHVVASIREPEGLSVIVAKATAERAGLASAFDCRWITLSVQSDLAAVGLTAAVARALARADIACNVVAGTHHDHLFVPIHRADDAMAVLARLSEEGS